MDQLWNPKNAVSLAIPWDVFSWFTGFIHFQFWNRLLIISILMVHPVFYRRQMQNKLMYEYDVMWNYIFKRKWKRSEVYDWKKGEKPLKLGMYDIEIGFEIWIMIINTQRKINEKNRPFHKNLKIPHWIKCIKFVQVILWPIFDILTSS